MTVGVAIIGSGNIGTDLMIKVLRLSEHLEMGAMVGIDPDSDGLARAAASASPTTADGVDGLIAHAGVRRHRASSSTPPRPRRTSRNAAALAPYGKRLVDLTPAAIGPYVVPGGQPRRAPRTPTNVNMVTCGGQATIPIVAAVAAVTPVAYAEIVASIASKSAGPGTRANIDEFTETTVARDRGGRRRRRAARRSSSSTRPSRR